VYRLCEDYNPLHAGNEFGKRAGFKGAILQGLGTWNIAVHGVLMEMGDSDPLKVPLFQGQTCQCRLPQYIFQTRTKCLCGADLKPGDCLETRIWKVGTKDGMDEIIFQTIVQSEALSVVVLACRLLSIL
jgi:peroxisomal enoyl-CoA hydratase 2